MLGKLALTVNGPEPGTCPFGGQQVPLTSIIFRQAAIFGGIRRRIIATAAKPILEQPSGGLV